MSQYFGPAAHVAEVVPDVDKTVDRMIASGIGPFYIMRNIKLSSKFRGKKGDVHLTVAFGYSGGVLFEAISQIDDTPSSFKEYLARFPEGGVHHVAYYVDRFDEALKNAVRQGADFNIVQEFLLPDGKPFEIYLEPKGQKNPLIIQLMLDSEFKEAFKRMEAEAPHWDGKNPKRDLFDLLSPETRATVGH